MYKKIILSFSLLAIGASAFGQSYSIQKDQDNPKNAKNLNISLLTGMNTSSRSFFNTIVQGNFSFSHFSFEGTVDPGVVWMPILKPEGTNNGWQPSTMFEASGSIYFLDKIKSTSYRYVISSNTVGNTTYTKYVPIPVFKRVQCGARGGLYRQRMSSGWGKNDSGYVAGQDYRTYGTASTFFGINFRKVRNFKVGLKEYKRLRGVKQTRDFYMDVFLSPGTTVIYNGNRDFQGGSDISKLGFRMGFNWRSNRVFGGNFKLEMGQLPGYKHESQAFYMQMSYGICISQFIGKKGDDIYKPTDK